MKGVVNMAFSNRMTQLLDKIERRLGTRQLNLPDYLNKDEWIKIIDQDTLSTFSRYFPHIFRYTIDQNTAKKGSYYLIDEDVVNGLEILGLRDISYESFCNDSLGQQIAYGYTAMLNNYSIADVALYQMRADMTSMFNISYFPEFFPPNKIRVKTAAGADVGTMLGKFDVDLFIKHNINLLTIEPTKMEIFEKLALADIATYLYNELKYFDDLSTVFANTNIRLSDIQDKANTRQDVENELKESYVSTANRNQPYLYCV